MLSRVELWPIGIAGAAIGFIAYCIKFDRDRRNHPEYKKKLVERRKKEQLHKPLFESEVEETNYFIQQIQAGGVFASRGISLLQKL
ncbi:hypothetical protein MXB_3235, partial [Myxobolus squamalis]